MISWIDSTPSQRGTITKGTVLGYPTGKVTDVFNVHQFDFTFDQFETYSTYQPDSVVTAWAQWAGLIMILLFYIGKVILDGKWQFIMPYFRVLLIRFVIKSNI